MMATNTLHITRFNLEEIARIAILVFVFVFTIKFFLRTPLEVLFFKLQTGFYALILLFIVAYISNIVRNSRKVNKVVLYYFLLIALVPVYGAFRAEAEFGQPFIYGFLSERNWLLIGVGIWFYYILVTGKIAFSTAESAYVFMAWASLIIFSLFVMTYDPSQLQVEGDSSKYVVLTKHRGVRFKFQAYFISFGTIYYFIKYSIDKKPKDLVILFLFLSYVLFVNQGRTYILTLAATILLYYWFNYSLSKLAVVMIKIALLLAFMLIAIQIVKPEYLDRMGFMFSQMFQVLTGAKSQDISANIRLMQSLVVLNHFQENPLSILLGSGSVSSQWNGGYESMYGHFFPSDIGVLGGLFVYGVIGFVFLVVIPIMISIQTIKRISEHESVFINALKYMLIYTLIRSIQGDFYYAGAGYAIPLFILIASLKRRDSNCAK